METARVGNPERLGETELATHRRFGWAEWGPIEGVPVLLCPGAATSRWLGFGADIVGSLGIRLISLDRPGLGASSPVPDRGLADFAQDIARFTQLRGLAQPAMVGNSQGAPFALACALSGTVSALALVSGADEVAAPAFTTLLPTKMRELVVLAREDPAGAQAIFERFDAQQMWDMVMGHSPESDVKVYREPKFSAAYRRALDEGFEQGPAGYARDTMLAMRPWGLELSEIEIPVTLWYGEHDTSHSPDNGATLSTRILRARRHLVRDAAGALLWTHSADILRELIADRSEALA